jgi:hypothetical protein
MEFRSLEQRGGKSHQIPLLHRVDALLGVPRSTTRLYFNNRYRATRREGNDVRFIVADAQVPLHDRVAAICQVLRGGAFASRSDFGA